MNAKYGLVKVFLVITFLSLLVQSCQPYLSVNQFQLSSYDQFAPPFNPTQSPSLPEDEIQDAVSYFFDGFTQVICEEASAGKLKPLDESLVPSTMPILDEAVYIKERVKDFVLDRESSSLSYLLFASYRPSRVGVGNAYVAATKDIFRQLPDTDLPSSRELELALRVLKSETRVSTSRMMQMALEVTGGDVPMALLTVHNFLKEVAYGVRGEGWGKDSPVSPQPQFFLTMDLSPSFWDSAERKQGLIELGKSYIEPYQKYLQKELSMKDNQLAREIKVEFEETLDSTYRLKVGLNTGSKLLAEKLEIYRPAGDSISDNLGPWYHAFGVMLLGSIAKGGRYTAYTWAEVESLMRHAPDFPLWDLWSSGPDPFKEGINLEASVAIGDALDCMKRRISGYIISGGRNLLVTTNEMADRYPPTLLKFSDCLCFQACMAEKWNCPSIYCGYSPDPGSSGGPCLCQGFGEGRANLLTGGEQYDTCAVQTGYDGPPPGGQPLVFGSNGQALRNGDQVFAGGENAHLALADGSQLLVKPGSVLTVEEPVPGRLEITQQGGSRYVHGYNDPSSVEFRLGDTWRVKPLDTEMTLDWDGGRGKVVVIEGEVTATSRDGKIVNLSPGQQLELPGGGVSTFDLSQDDGDPVGGVRFRDLPIDPLTPMAFGDFKPGLEDGKLPADWLWQDPGSDATVEIPGKGTLKVSVPDGNVFQGKDSTAPRLLHKVTGDFNLQGSVQLESQGRNNAAVQFILYAPGTSLGFKAGQMWTNPPNADYRLVSGGWWLLDGINKLSMVNTPLADGPNAPGEAVIFRLARRGGLISASWSLDGQNWNLSDAIDTPTPDTLWVGWVFTRSALDGMKDKPAIVTVRDFSLSTRPRGRLDTIPWGLVQEGGTAEPQERSVLLSVSDAHPGYAGAWLGGQWQNDLDAVVSFKADTWVQAPGTSRSLNFFAQTADGSNRVYIMQFESDGSARSYRTALQGAHVGFNSVEATDNNGALRLVRWAGAWSSYYLKDCQWVKLGDFTNGFSESVILGLSSRNNLEAETPAAFAVQFTVESILEGEDVGGEPWIPVSCRKS